MSSTFSDPPEAAFHLARMLSAFTSGGNTNFTRDDDDKVIIDNIDGATGEGFPTVAESSSSGNTDQDGNSNHSDDDGRDTYEFVAFLLWYLFLVICCVLPTCFAYRRRRIVEARMAQQQANFDRLRQQNVILLSNLSPDQMYFIDNEEVKAERTRRITAELESTTFTVQAKDISENDKGKDSYVSNNDDGGEDEISPAASAHVDEEMGIVVLDDDAMDQTLLTLPREASSQGDEKVRRTVPGGCAICLCSYEEGDDVAWSRKESCLHAFHRDCIIPWLAKKNEPKCPCCRQDFCTIEPILPSEEEQQQNSLPLLTPLGFISTAMAAPVRNGRLFFRRGPSTSESMTTVDLSSSQQDYHSEGQQNQSSSSSTAVAVTPISVMPEQEMTHLPFDEERLQNQESGNGTSESNDSTRVETVATNLSGVEHDATTETQEPSNEDSDGQNGRN